MHAEKTVSPVLTFSNPAEFQFKCLVFHFIMHQIDAKMKINWLDQIK